MVERGDKSRVEPERNRMCTGSAGSANLKGLPYPSPQAGVTTHDRYPVHVAMRPLGTHTAARTTDATDSPER
jgi:hypothetical protein